MFKVQTGHLSNSTGLCLRSNSAVQIGGMGRFDRSVEHSGWEAVVANFALKASETCAVIACTVGHSILAIDDELNLLVIPPSQVSTSPYLVTHATRWATSRVALDRCQPPHTQSGITTSCKGVWEVGEGGPNLAPVGCDRLIKPSDRWNRRLPV